MTEENTRCRHKITFGSYILSDYYEYCVCKKCKKKFEVKKKKFDWLNLLIPLMCFSHYLVARINSRINNPALKFTVILTPIIVTFTIMIIVMYRRYRIFCQSIYQNENEEETSGAGNGQGMASRKA